MKKIKSIACFVACVTALSSVMTYAPSANAESEMVYGTMNIPYSDFYRAELEESVNKYDVDAVSSATTGFPEDYKMTYSADGLEATVENGKITYSNAVPGSYTLNINDADGKYAPMSATFTLSTDSLPVSFENEKIALIILDFWLLRVPLSQPATFLHCLFSIN